MAEEVQNQNHIRLVGMVAGMGSGKRQTRSMFSNKLNISCPQLTLDRFDEGGYAFVVFWMHFISFTEGLFQVAVGHG